MINIIILWPEVRKEHWSQRIPPSSLSLSVSKDCANVRVGATRRKAGKAKESHWNSKPPPPMH